MLHPRPSQLTVSKNKCFLNPQKGRGRTLKRRDLRGGFRAGFLYPVVDFLVGTKDGSYPNPYLSSNLFPAKPLGAKEGDSRPVDVLPWPAQAFALGSGIS